MPPPAPVLRQTGDIEDPLRDYMDDRGGTLSTRVERARWWAPDPETLDSDGEALRWPDGQGRFLVDRGRDPLSGLLRLKGASDGEVLRYARSHGILGLRWPVADRRLGALVRDRSFEGVQAYVGRAGSEPIALWHCFINLIWQLLFGGQEVQRGLEPSPKLQAALDALAPLGPLPPDLLAATSRFRSDRLDAVGESRLMPDSLVGIEGIVEIGPFALGGEFWTGENLVSEGFATLAAWTGLSFEVRVQASTPIEAGVYPATLGQVLVWKALLVAMRAKELAVCTECGDMFDRRNKRTRVCSDGCQRTYRSRQRADQRRRQLPEG